MTKKAFRTRCKALRLRAQGGGTACGERHAAGGKSTGRGAQSTGRRVQVLQVVQVMQVVQVSYNEETLNAER